MNLSTYRKRFALGALAGAVVLGLFNVLATYAEFQAANSLHNHTDVLAENFNLLYWRLGLGTTWGSVLGWRITEAMTAWRTQNRTSARRTLFDTGYQAASFQILILISSIPSLQQSDGSTMAAYFMSDVSLQAMLLMIITGKVLPLENANSVQVTESLRL